MRALRYIRKEKENRLTFLLSDRQDWVEGSANGSFKKIDSKCSLGVCGVKFSLIFAFSSALSFIPLMKPPIIPATRLWTMEFPVNPKYTRASTQFTGRHEWILAFFSDYYQYI